MRVMLSTALGVAAGLVALAFALSTFERWQGGRRRHELAWTVALAMFSMASFALAAGSQGGWDGPTFRLFWLFGAVANVPVLALGTIYLLGGPRTGDRWAVVIGLAVAFAAGVIVTAPFLAPLPAKELPQGSEVFGPLPRILAAVASGGGAVVVFAGAAWSAVRYRGGRMTVANLLIAVGTAVTGASGLANSVLGHMTAFAVFLVAGIVVIFAGFLVASSTTAAPTRREPDDAAGARPRRETAGLSAALGVEASPPRPAEAIPRT
jgi:hypothetical protein